MTDHVRSPALSEDDLAALAERVDSAFAEVQTLEAAAQGKAKALKSAIEEFHKVGLTKIVQHLKEDDRGRELLFELVDDPSVYALFSMHGLVRADLRTRVSRTIEMVRPYMQSHGGDVMLADVKEDAVFVRLSGACNGCSMSAVTLRDTVEQALKEHVPEIAQVHVIADEPDGVIPEQALLGAFTEADAANGWVEGPAMKNVEEGVLVKVDAGDVSILLCVLKARSRPSEMNALIKGCRLTVALLMPTRSPLLAPGTDGVLTARAASALTLRKRSWSSSRPESKMTRFGFVQSERQVETRWKAGHDYGSCH